MELVRGVGILECCIALSLNTEVSSSQVISGTSMLRYRTVQ